MIHGLSRHQTHAPRDPAHVGSNTAPARTERRPDPCTLTPRERDTWNLIALGASEKEVAARLGLTHASIHKWVANLRSKLECRSQAELVALWHGTTPFGQRGESEILL